MTYYVQYHRKETEPRYPVCRECESTIYDWYYEIEGEIYCERCMELNFRKDADYYEEETYD